MGGAQADIDVVESITGCRDTIAKLAPEDSGRFLAWNGAAMPY